jgi:hypothetical protein
MLDERTLQFEPTEGSGVRTIELTDVTKVKRVVAPRPDRAQPRGEREARDRLLPLEAGRWRRRPVPGEAPPTLLFGNRGRSRPRGASSAGRTRAIWRAPRRSSGPRRRNGCWRSAPRWPRRKRGRARPDRLDDGDLRPRDSRKVTVPGRVANSVSSPPLPTPHRVDLGAALATMIEPAVTTCHRRPSFRVAWRLNRGRFETSRRPSCVP